MEPEADTPQVSKESSEAARDRFLDSLGLGGFDQMEDEPIALSSQADDISLPGAPIVAVSGNRSVSVQIGGQAIPTVPAHREVPFNEWEKNAEEEEMPPPLPPLDEFQSEEIPAPKPVEGSFDDAFQTVPSGDADLSLGMAPDQAICREQEAEAKSNESSEMVSDDSPREELVSEIPVETETVEETNEPEPTAEESVETKAAEELLALHCPKCEGELVLRREHVGVEGACVWCGTKIVAAESGLDRQVRIFALFQPQIPAQEEVEEPAALPEEESVSDEAPAGIPAEEASGEESAAAFVSTDAAAEGFSGFADISSGLGSAAIESNGEVADAAWETLPSQEGTPLETTPEESLPPMRPAFSPAVENRPMPQGFAGIEDEPDFDAATVDAGLLPEGFSETVVEEAVPWGPPRQIELDAVPVSKTPNEELPQPSSGFDLAESAGSFAEISRELPDGAEEVPGAALPRIEDKPLPSGFSGAEVSSELMPVGWEQPGLKKPDPLAQAPRPFEDAWRKDEEALPAEIEIESGDEEFLAEGEPEEGIVFSDSDDEPTPIVEKPLPSGGFGETMFGSVPKDAEGPDFETEAIFAADDETASFTDDMLPEPAPQTISAAASKKPGALFSSPEAKSDLDLPQEETLFAPVSSKVMASMDPPSDERRAEEEAAPDDNIEKSPISAMAPPLAGGKPKRKTRKGMIVFCVILIGFVCGAALATFLLPVDDYVAKARIVLQEKLDPASASMYRPTVPTTDSETVAPAPLPVPTSPAPEAQP